MSPMSTKSWMSMVRVFAGSSSDELVAREGHVVVRGDLIALDDLVVGDLLVGALRDPAVAHPGIVGLAQFVEADRLARDRAVELDRDVEEPEGDRSGPDCACHGPHSSRDARPALPARPGRSPSCAAGSAGGLDPARDAGEGSAVAAGAELRADVGDRARGAVGDRHEEPLVGPAPAGEDAAAIR